MVPQMSIVHYNSVITGGTTGSYKLSLLGDLEISKGGFHHLVNL